MKAKYCNLFVLLLISSCSFNLGTINENSLLGTWRLYDIEPVKNGIKTDDSFSKMASLKKVVQDGDVLCFFENKSYSEIKGDGKFKAGNWKFSASKSISFIDSGKNGDPIKLELEKNGFGKQQLILTYEKQNIAMTFIKESESLKEFNDDPFFPANNQWRIKPAQPENSVQLTNRLANYFKHLALILKSAKERKQDVVYFEFSKGPIKIYNGGIGIYPYKIIPESWKNSFFDEGDASTAYRKYEDYLTTSHYRGAGTGDWIEDDYNILLSIYADFNK